MNDIVLIHLGDENYILEIYNCDLKKRYNTKGDLLNIIKDNDTIFKHTNNRFIINLVDESNHESIITKIINEYMIEPIFTYYSICEIEIMSYLFKNNIKDTVVYFNIDDDFNGGIMYNYSPIKSKSNKSGKFNEILLTTKLFGSRNDDDSSDNNVRKVFSKEYLNEVRDNYSFLYTSVIREDITMSSVYTGLKMNDRVSIIIFEHLLDVVFEIIDIMIKIIDPSKFVFYSKTYNKYIIYFVEKIKEVFNNDEKFDELEIVELNKLQGLIGLVTDERL